MGIRRSAFERVDLGGLMVNRIVVPGEGQRLLMCLATTPGDGDGDGLMVVAVAEDGSWETLTERARAGGLYVRYVHETWKHGDSMRQQFVRTGTDGAPPSRSVGYGIDVFVLDAPPVAMAGLPLESRFRLQEAVQARIALAAVGTARAAVEEQARARLP